MDLALVTFAVETMISYLAKVHGQSVLRHGQSFARNSRFQITLGDLQGPAKASIWLRFLANPQPS